MSDNQSRWSLSYNTKRLLGLGSAFAVAVAAIGGYRSYEVVPPQSFGVRVTAGEVHKKLLEPGLKWKYPFLDKIHTFSNNVIILEATVGGTRNTQDQNTFTAEMRLHYQIDPDAGVLSFHLDEMGNENGKTLIEQQMSKSIDAVVGQRTTGQSLSSSPEILQDFVKQLEWRLKQNNIAVKIDTVEYLTANMGNGVRLPVQLRVKPGQAVESMAGPSAVPVAPSVR